MKRKFINALLFGSLLLAAPAGTFVSCSDYDDDIKSLQQQITTNATDLNGLVEEKIRNVNSEIDALKVADDQLADAIEQAQSDAEEASLLAAQQLVNNAKSELETALEEAKGQLNDKIDGYVGADGTLTLAVNAAAARAEQAYTLAEQAKALADGNKEELGRLSENLSTINETLSGQISALSDDVTALSQQLEQRAAAIEGQIAALNVPALQEQSDENKQKIEALRTDLTTLQQTVAANKTELENLVAQEIQTVSGQITSINTKISALETAYAAADQALQNQITALDGRLTTLQASFTTLENRVSALSAEIDGLINVLFANLSNLITGVILQDDQLEFAYAQVVDVDASPMYRPTTSITGNVYTRTSGTTKYVVFPYVGADGSRELTVGRYNVEKNGGLLYVTLNPTNINFSEKVNLALENSVQEAPETETGKITLDLPEISEGHLITRATDGNKNGLYQVRAKYENLDETKAPADFKNDYAVYSWYTQNVMKADPVEEGESKTEAITKKVYSKYELKLGFKQQQQIMPQYMDIKAIDASSSAPAGVDYRFVVDADAELTGSFQMLPNTNENGKEGSVGGTNYRKVFRKYVEIVGVWNARNEDITASSAGKAAIANVTADNSDALNKIFEEGDGAAQAADEDNGFERIKLTVRDDYNGYTFKLRYYVQNYNGAISVVERTVLFTKPMFNENTLTINHTPTSANSQETVTTNSEFFKNAVCINNSVCNEKWVKGTYKIEITGDAPLKAINFYDAKTPQNQIANIVFASGSTSAEKTGLTETQMGNIKNMSIVYMPNDLKVENEYKLTINYYDQNDNLISSMPVIFTMKYPTEHAALIEPNPLYFGYEENIKIDKLNGETYTAWAWYDATTGTAWYNLSVGFNPPYHADDDCNIRFDLKDRADYQSGGQYASLAPEWSDLPLSWNSSVSDYRLHVPVAAVKNGEEHSYEMGVAVEYFDVYSLWYDPQPFNLVFKSAIAHVPLNENNSIFTNNSYEVPYPNGVLSLTDTNIKADDPATSAVDDISYFGNNPGNVSGSSAQRRVKSVGVEIDENYRQYRSLFKNVAIRTSAGSLKQTVDESETATGISVETAEEVEGGTAAITSLPIQFNFIVEDYFGNTMKYPFYVKVARNSANANKK